MIELINVHVQKISTMADGGIKIELRTRDLPANEKFKLFEAFNQEETVKFEPKGDLKTHSERLRNNLYVLWNKRKEESKVFMDIYDNFEDYYAHSMNTLIENIQSKIKEYET